jgi:hypothetical protein
MNALQLAVKVAAHPVMVKLRAQQDAMRRQMVRDYGDNFMMSTQEMPNLVFPNGRKSPRFAGVHFWTMAQRNEWFAIERRMRNARTALKSAYAAV